MPVQDSTHSNSTSVACNAQCPLNIKKDHAVFFLLPASTNFFPWLQKDLPSTSRTVPPNLTLVHRSYSSSNPLPEALLTTSLLTSHKCCPVIFAKIHDPFRVEVIIQAFKSYLATESLRVVFRVILRGTSFVSSYPNSLIWFTQHDHRTSNAVDDISWSGNHNHANRCFGRPFEPLEHV